VEGENRVFVVLSIAGGFFALALSMIFGSPVASAISAIFFFFSILLWKYGYMIIPMITKWAKIIEIGKGFEILPGQEVIVGKKSGRFLATAFLSAHLYQVENQKERKNFSEMFEKAITAAGFPFKVCMQVSHLDLKDEINEAKTKRSIAETKKAQLKKDEAEKAFIEREIVMWDRLIERLENGEKPLEILFYFSTTASGRTKEEAIASVNSQAEELSAILSGALSCEVFRLKGEEMKKCFWLDFFGPTNSEDLKDLLF